MSTSQPVGIIGLGIMGSAMARHLLGAGFRVLGHDIREEQEAEFRRAGGETVPSARRIAAGAEIIITSLPSTAALDAVIGDLDEGDWPGRILIETSTLPLAARVAAERRLAARGIVMLDCPLSGSGEQAKLRDVVVYGSGPREAYDRCLPVLNAFSRAPHHLGPFGNGTKMKYVANLLVAIHTAAAAEAFSMARMAGLDLAQMFEVVADGAGASSSLRVRGPMLISGSFTPVRTMPLDLWRKDLRVIAEFADGLSCPTPLFAAAVPLFNAAVAAGHGGEDTAAVARTYAGMVGETG